jgi:DnaK suppressor protein
LDEERARALLRAERARVEELLGRRLAAPAGIEGAVREPGDWVDRAEPISEEELDDAVTYELRSRLAAIERAEKRLEEGTYGRSILSGAPIADERLEADPAAELTVEEARKA